MFSKDQKIYKIDIFVRIFFMFISLIFVIILASNIKNCMNNIGATSVSITFFDPRVLLTKYMSSSSSSLITNQNVSSKIYEKAYFRFLINGEEAVRDYNSAVVFNNFNYKADQLMDSLFLMLIFEAIYSFIPLFFNIYKKQNPYSFIALIIINILLVLFYNKMSVIYIWIYFISHIIIIGLNIYFYLKYKKKNDEFNERISKDLHLKK